MSTIHHSDSITKRTFFNKYKPVKKLGEGSFGKIYSAVNITTQQKYALKMVRILPCNWFVFIGKKRGGRKSVGGRGIYFVLFERM